MEYKVTRQGRLPACRLSESMLREVWAVFHAEEGLKWEAVVGTGGDLLGKHWQRSQQTVTDWDELVSLLRSLPRVDSLTITFEALEKGALAIAFKNYPPVGGSIVAAGHEAAWVEARMAAVMAVVTRYCEPFTTRLYSRLGFSVIQTAIPLTAAFMVVVLAAGLVIPREIRQSEYLWWITAATVVATLRLAYTVSDRLIMAALKRYPYIRWAEKTE